YSTGNSSVVVLQGSTTDAHCFFKITVPRNQRHTGIAGTGVVLDGSNNTKFGVRAHDNYTVVEWLEMKGFDGTGLAGAVSALGGGRGILFNGLLIHDFFNGANAATGARVFTGNNIPVSFTVRNCTIYNGDQVGVQNGDCDSTVTIQNSTI